MNSDSLDDRKRPSKASVPIFEGPSVQGLLDYYRYNDIEKYQSWNYFPSTDKENTDNDITDKDTTDKDCIHECNHAMSKANVTTWEEIKNEMGVGKSKICADKLAFASKHLQIAFASCICNLHLQVKVLVNQTPLKTAGDQLYPN
ncbi:hypothetical protein Tco_0639102 [Tanacetum coccineum]